MSDFKYLNDKGIEEFDVCDSYSEIYLNEIAYQLKRIADCMENKKK